MGKNSSFYLDNLEIILGFPPEGMELEGAAMELRLNIRTADDNDREKYLDLAEALSRFNRAHHDERCEYDNYDSVLAAVSRRAAKIFDGRDEDILILLAEIDHKPVGYVLARIYAEEDTADNGTGRMGLIDELFLREEARGVGLGQKLFDGAAEWMKVRKIHRVKLHAYSWNQHARKMYERNGFAEYAVSYEKYIDK